MATAELPGRKFVSPPDGGRQYFKGVSAGIMGVPLSVLVWPYSHGNLPWFVETGIAVGIAMLFCGTLQGQMQNWRQCVIAVEDGWIHLSKPESCRLSNLRAWSAITNEQSRHKYMFWAFFPWSLLGKLRRGSGGIRSEQQVILHRVPVQALTAVNIRRSHDGKYALVQIRDESAEPYLLYDPDDVDLLEEWAITIAQSAGVAVTVKRSSGIWWEPLTCFVMGILVSTLWNVVMWVLFPAIS